MHYAKPYKTKQFFFVLIKFSIVVGAFYFIYSKLTDNDNLQLSAFVNVLREKEVFLLKNITSLLFLTLLNWFFEILKWQLLVKTLKNISFTNALEQSLGGLTTSLITPNRIGDYGAKAMYYASQLRPKILLLNLLGNISQMTITTIFGSIGLILFVNRYPIDIDYYKWTKFGIIFILISTLIVIGLKQTLFKTECSSFKRVFVFFKKIPTKTHITNLGFSLIRYLIFSFQFYYLLTLFGAHVEYTTAMVLISSTYLLASIIPSLSIFDVLIKGSVALLLFGYIDVNELTILSITTSMWILNFVIPSVFGSYFVLNFKLYKTNL